MRNFNCSLAPITTKPVSITDEIIVISDDEDASTIPAVSKPAPPAIKEFFPSEPKINSIQIDASPSIFDEPPPTPAQTKENDQQIWEATCASIFAATPTIQSNGSSSDSVGDTWTNFTNLPISHAPPSKNTIGFANKSGSFRQEWLRDSRFADWLQFKNQKMFCRHCGRYVAGSDLEDLRKHGQSEVHYTKQVQMLEKIASRQMADYAMKPYAMDEFLDLISWHCSNAEMAKHFMCEQARKAIRKKAVKLRNSDEAGVANFLGWEE